MASRGRRYKDAAADFNFFLEQEIDCLEKELSTKTYCHGKYRTFTIYEPKERKIAAAPFRDRVIHHAVHGVLEPLIDGGFIYDSYACRKGKGTHKAVGRAQSFLKLNKFCFHGDIRKYFPSIDHKILKELVAKKVEDKSLLWLMGEIVDSAKQITGGRNKGLPLGNLTSQFFANLYLNELDWLVKCELRCAYYARYMDDFLVFNDSKTELQEIKNKIRIFLEKILSLDLHEGKSQIYKTSSGVRFLGFRMFKNYRKLASNNVRNFKRRLKKFDYLLSKGEINEEAIKDSIRCWVAHSRYADTKALRFKLWQNLTEKNAALGEVIKDVFPLHASETKTKILGNIRRGARCCARDEKRRARNIDKRAQDVAPLHSRGMENARAAKNVFGMKNMRAMKNNAFEMNNVGAQHFAPVMKNNAFEMNSVGTGYSRPNEINGCGNHDLI